MLRKSLVATKGWMCLLVLVLTFSACSKAPKDDTISQALKASFYSDPELKNESIDVTVANGEVTLVGEVSSDAARLRAFKLANETAGVKKVIDATHMKAQNDSIPPGQQPAEGVASTAMAPPPPPQEPKREAPPPPPPPKIVTVPAGTEVRVQMIDSISSKTGKVGSAYL